ncbi:hypothetical protein GE09DRAFT_1250333 [Coniochaeta sp. 2T2.1]|nr:hypothetical protein GE09DRAFT_1250333 [Coniochaeta sp. 2T2.1]
MDFRIPDDPVDVAIHCGDLTEESKLEEFRKSIDQLERTQAPLKLVIAGDHDFTLDTPTFRKIADHAFTSLSVDPELMKKECGEPGEARQLFSASDDILFLDEGIHHFNLSNGARLTEVDVLVTHGPPKGIGYLDRTVFKQRGGCDHLFSAIAKVRPRLHCFGHIYEGWGAMLVVWKGDEAKSDTPQQAWEREERYQRLVKDGFRGTSHCLGDEHPLTPDRHTLFVNAAVESLEEEKAQLPWIVEIELPRSASPNRLASA